MDETSIAAVPRYANVIRFAGCKDLSVSDLTAGHTREPGFCTGGVLFMDNCDDSNVDKCGLYGCGTVGVIAYNCKKINVTGCDIYECSVGAVEVHDSNDILVSGCDRASVIDGAEAVNKSWPGFFRDLSRMGGHHIP